MGGNIMSDHKPHNCIVCAKEFIPSEINSVRLSKINSTCFKVCAGCVISSDPSDDYKQVRDIVDSYLKFSSRQLFEEVKEIISK